MRINGRQTGTRADAVMRRCVSSKRSPLRPRSYAAVQENSKIQRVASPRNHLYLDHEVVRLRRPLTVCGGTQHSGQVALQRELQLIAIGLEQDRFDQASNRLGCAGATIVVQDCIDRPRGRGAGGM